MAATTITQNTSQPGRKPTIAFDRGKRLFDITFALAALATLSPLMLLVAAAVKARLGSPVLFRQLRPGQHGRPFILLKFRTMRDATNSDGRVLDDAQRLTEFGQRLRQSSLDELPQLWNVLRGDMSLVGPRPLLMQYLQRYTPGQARRHEVRPGITGWAQVNGRNAISWEDRLRLDVWYVDHRSLLLDLRIVAKTFGRLIKRDGISQPGHATMEEFGAPQRQ